MDFSSVKVKVKWSGFYLTSRPLGSFCPWTHLFLSRSFSFHFPLSVFIRLFLCAFASLFFETLPLLLMTSCGFRLGLLQWGGGHIWSSPVLSIEGGRRGCDFAFLTPDSLFLQGRDPRMEQLMWIAAQGDWIPIKRPSAWPGASFPSQTQPL